MRALLALATLVPTLALGAVNTVQITGAVLDPGAVGVTSGAITCALSQPGSALDGAISQRVGASATFTLGAAGALPASAVLVPNDIITPAGTVYSCTFSVRLTTGRPASWTETWQLASTPDPIDIGAIPRVAPPGATFVAGPQGPPGVVAATAPVTYDSPTQTVAFNPASLNASSSLVTATGGTKARTLAARAADVANVLDFGASGSAQTTTGSITSGSNQLTVASAIDFAVGQGISVANAGPASALLVTSIAAINGLVFTLAGNAGTNATNKAVKHDDTAAIQAALTSVQAGGTVLFTSGYYRISSTISVVSSPAWSPISIVGSQSVGPSPLAYQGSPTVDSSAIVTGGIAFNCTGNNTVAFRGFTIVSTSGSVIQISVYFAKLNIDNMLIYGGQKGVRAQYALPLLMTNSHLTNFGTASGDYALGIAGSQVEIRGSMLANSGPAGTTNPGGNLYAFSPASDLILDAVQVDEGGGASLDLQYVNRAAIRNTSIFLSGGGYGVRIGANATNVLLDHVRIIPFDVNRVPVNTIIAAGSGHRFVDVSTNPNGGGDIADTSTDSTYENVNGKWKQPFTDASGTPGNATINKASGKVAIAVGAAAVTVTNSLVTAASIVMATIQTADATLTFLKSVVPGAGTFTVTGNANATAATTVAFTVQN